MSGTTQTPSAELSNFFLSNTRYFQMPSTSSRNVAFRQLGERRRPWRAVLDAVLRLRGRSIRLVVDLMKKGSHYVYSCAIIPSILEEYSFEKIMHARLSPSFFKTGRFGFSFRWPRWAPYA